MVLWSSWYILTASIIAEFVYTAHIGAQNFTICQNDNCKRAATRILNAMNKSADPCENFYNYACGNWKITSDMPKRIRKLSQDALLTQKIKQRFKEILEEPVDANEDDLLTKLKSLYRSCMDLENRDKIGVRPITNLLNRVGGWPMAMEYGAWQNRTWQEIDNYYLQLDGSAAFFRFVVRTKYDNINRTILVLHPSNSIPFNADIKKYTTSKDLRNPYPKIIARIAEIIAEDNGIEVSSAKIMNEAMEIYDFQKNLADVLSEKNLEESERDVVVMNVTYAQTRYDKLMKDDALIHYNDSEQFSGDYDDTKVQINFLNMLESYLNNTGIEVNEALDVEFFNFASLLKLAKLLSRTPLRVIVNYIHYSFVARRMKYTTRQMLNLYADGMSYNDVRIYKEWPQWKWCMNDIKMSSALTYYYLQKHYSDDNIPLVNEVIEAVKDKTLRQIQQSAWMNDNTKELARQKLLTMKTFIGYPKNAKNLTHQSQLYANVSIRENYVEAMLSQQRANLKNYLKKLTLPYDKEQWLVDATAVNAFYVLNGNVMYVPAGITQDPYFLPDLPIAAIYGSLGFIIGHEISHGFVAEALFFFSGRLYHVNNDQGDWWSDEMQKIYDDRVSCFVEQFDKYTVVIPTDPPKIIKLNGKHVLAENIADTSGVITAFSAFRAKSQEKGEATLKLPGLEDCTDDQLFFLSMANIWCTVQRPYDTEESIRRDKHSPVAARVIGTLSNSEEFSKAFMCPVGSAMNPPRKCNIW